MDLDRIAAHLGVDVVIGHPIAGEWGEYHHAAHRIVLRPHLGPSQRRSVLAHELGHSLHRHESSTAITERQADHAAHWLTIPLCGFLRAAQEQDTPQGVAAELGVMPADIRAYAKRLGLGHGC